jgi:hypothetical protein
LHLDRRVALLESARRARTRSSAACAASRSPAVPAREHRLDLRQLVAQLCLDRTSVLPSRRVTCSLFIDHAKSTMN